MIKGKRSKRPRPSSPLALTMATSSSTTEFSGVSHSTSDHRVTLSTSNSVEFARRTDEDEDEEEDMANCLILLAKGLHDQKSHHDQTSYQCKTCHKSFHSFQALGGHRASHKIKPNKPNEPNTDHNGSLLSLQIPSRVIVGTSPQNIKSRVHECSICGAEFASGQALGGHMRLHRPVAPPEKSRDDSESQEVKKQRNMLSLDLNLPAPEDDSKFNPYANKEQVIVFSASPLVDCQY